MSESPLSVSKFEGTGSSPFEIPYGEFVPKLLASYERFGGWNNAEALNLPSKNSVGQICEDLLKLLFPGFLDSDVVPNGTLAELTARRLWDVISRLEDQVRKSVRIGNPNVPTGKTPPIMQKFCRALHIVREVLRADGSFA